MRGYEESIKTFGLAANAGPLASTHKLNFSDSPGVKYIEAWLSNFGASNVHIFEGGLSLAQCQNDLETGITDVLLTVTGSGPVSRRLPNDVGAITVHFEATNTADQFQLVTVKVLKYRE